MQISTCCEEKQVEPQGRRVCLARAMLHALSTLCNKKFLGDGPAVWTEPEFSNGLRGFLRHQSWRFMMIYDDLWWFVIQSIKIGMISPNHCGRGCGCRLASWPSWVQFLAQSTLPTRCSFGIASCPGGYVFHRERSAVFPAFALLAPLHMDGLKISPFWHAGIQFFPFFVSTHMSMWRYWLAIDTRLWESG